MKARDVNDILREDGVDALRRALDTAVPVYTTDDAAAERRAAKPASPKPRAPKDQPGPERRTQAQALLAIALAGDVTLYRSPDGTTYADVTVAGHRETWPTRSRGFRRWLQRRYYEETGGAANGDAMATAMGVIEAKAQFGGRVHEVFLRVAAHGEAIYIDLCDDTWRAVEIDAEGWRLIATPPVRFRRSPTMGPLPTPALGGRITELRRHLNVSDRDFVLAVGWLVTALRGRGPYPILLLSGEQGTGKSTAAMLLRKLIDPNVAPLRGPPRDLRDLAIAAFNAHVLAFDNLSGISAELADALCRLSTGGGFSTRALYSDDEERVFDGQRPIICTSINDIGTRSDLSDRSIVALLQAIEAIGRKTDRDVHAAFDAAAPTILGALFDAVAEGLRMERTVKLNRLPRMADHAVWVRACEGALWPEKIGQHLDIYDANRGEAAEIVLDADVVACAVRQHMDGRSEIAETSTGLLAALAAITPEHVRRGREWPPNARALAGRLRRLAPALRRIGLLMVFEREADTGRRIVRITKDTPQK